MKPTLCFAVEVATWIRNGRAKRYWTGGAIDRRRVSIERVQVDYADERVAFRIEDAQNIIRRLENESITHAKPLVWWLDGELISIVGKTLIMKVEAIEGSFHCVVVFSIAPMFCPITMTMPPMSHLAIQSRKSSRIIASVSITTQCRVNFKLPISVYS
jgi:hypothetical protein